MEVGKKIGSINCKSEKKATEWTLETIRKAYEKVAKDEIGRVGIVKEILRNSTEFLRRIIAPVGRNGRSHFVVCFCPQCNLFHLEDCIWWVSSGHGRKHCRWWCAVCGGQYEWRHQTEFWWCSAWMPAKQRFSKHMWCHKGHVNISQTPPAFLANQQTDGDSPIQSIVTGLHERS